MADNVAITPGAGATIATDDIGGFQFQRIKLIHGADGVNDGDVSSANGLPVSVVAALPAGANIIGALSANQSVNMSQMNGVAVTMGNGAAGTGVQRVTIASDSTGQIAVTGAALTALQLIDNVVFVDDAAFTPGTSSINSIGLLADETSTDNVDEGDLGAPRMTLNRMQIATVRPNGAGEGLDTYRNIDLDEADVQIKATEGKVYGWFMYNAAATVRYVKFYDATAASVTVGSTTPFLTIPIPPGSAANVEYTNGIKFSTAITVAAVTGVADASTGAPAANDVQVNIFYK